MLVLQGTRARMLEVLRAGGEETDILLKVKPSALLIAAILNGTKARKIICSEGIRKTFTKRMLGALSQMGVEIVITELKRGRPFSVDEGKIGKARELIKQGKTRKEVAAGAGMSERTLYYRLARGKKGNI